MTVKNLEKAIRHQECSRVGFQSTEWATRCDEPLRGLRQRDIIFQLRGRNRIVGMDNITLKKLKLVQNQEGVTTTINPEKAIVDEEIRPGDCGRVHFQNSWWPARCELDMTFQRGELVNVLGIDNITLIVGP